MATQIKRLTLVCLVALLEATYVSSTTAVNLPGFGGGRKLLYRFNGNKLASKVAATQEGMDTRVDYGEPRSNPPYHVDPPSPFTMTSLDKAKSQETVFDIQIDYAPVKTHPSDSGVAGSKNDYGVPRNNPPYHVDPPSPFTMTSLDKVKSQETVFDIEIDYASVKTHPSASGVASSKTDVGSHSHHLQYPSPVPDYQDYPPLYKNPGGVASSKTVGSHSNSLPLTPSPVPDYQDYPPLYRNPGLVASSKTVGFHTDSASLNPYLAPDYLDYPPLYVHPDSVTSSN